MGMILEYMDYHLLPLSLLFAAILFSVCCLGLYLRERSRAGRIEALVAGEREFFKSFAVNRRDFFLLIRRSDLKVLYISPNFQEMTGIEAELVCADIEVLKSLVSPKTARNILEQLGNWDGEQELRLEFDYQMAGEAAGENREESGDRHGLVTLQSDESSACYLVVFCDNTEDYQVRTAMKAELKQAYQETE